MRLAGRLDRLEKALDRELNAAILREAERLGLSEADLGRLAANEVRGWTGQQLLAFPAESERRK